MRHCSLEKMERKKVVRGRRDSDRSHPVVAYGQARARRRGLRGPAASLRSRDLIGGHVMTRLLILIAATFALGGEPSTLPAPTSALNVMCCDGTRSPTCDTCHRGCCSWHGGCCGLAPGRPDGGEQLFTPIGG